MFREPSVYSFTLEGGLDQNSSVLKIHPGKMISCDGLEIVANEPGYHRKAGYERCTNDTLPSDTDVIYLEIETITGTITAGDDFECGSVLIRPLESLAAPEDGDILPCATHSLSSIEVGDTFTDGSNSFDVAAIEVGRDHYTQDEIITHQKAAIEDTRDNIPVVPGTGSVLGGFRLGGYNYVFRNTATAAKLYKGIDYDWEEVALPDILYFDEGTVEFEVGETLTDGTATAVIASVTRQTGSWDAGAATADQSAGYMTLTTVVGTFTNNATLTGGGGGSAKANGVNTTYALNSNGRYQTVKHNFTNVADADHIYGVSGTNEAFEFDGTNYIPIYHPDTTDYPNHILVHQERLMLAFPGGEWVYSISGSPRIYNDLLGAGTHSCGAEITGTQTVQGNTAVAFTEGSFWLLTGDGVYDDTTSTRNWSFFEYDENVGAEEYSIAGMGEYLFLNRGEVRSLKTTAAYGGFMTTPMATEIKRFLSEHVGAVVGSLWVHSKGQYRIFFSDGRAAYITLAGGKFKGATTVIYPDEPTVVWSAVESGVQYLFFAADDGYLYRMDSGNTCDGDYIEGSFRLPFFHYGSVRNTKQFMQMIIEFLAPSVIGDDTEFTYTVNYSHGSPDAPRPLGESLSDIPISGGIYDSNLGYGNFSWSGPVTAEIVAYLEGYGANMSPLISFQTKYDSSFSFLSVIVDYINMGTEQR